MRGVSKPNFFLSHFLSGDELLFDNVSNTAKRSTPPKSSPSFLQSCRLHKETNFSSLARYTLQGHGRVGRLGWVGAWMETLSASHHDSLQHVLKTPNWTKQILCLSQGCNPKANLEVEETGKHKCPILKSTHTPLMTEGRSVIIRLPSPSHVQDQQAA